MTLRSQICVSHRDVENREGSDPSREVETRDSSVNRAKEGKRDSTCSIGPFCPTRYENPKGLLFFLPSSVKEASGKFFESAAGAADYFAPAVAETERGLIKGYDRGRLR